MLNKLKRGVKYIIKKIKRGVEIVAKSINDAKCVVAEVESKKIDLIRDAGTTIHEDIKDVISVLKDDNARVKIGYVGLCLSVGLILSGKLK